MENKEILEVVKSRHPDYSEMLDHWNFLFMTYEGGREWFEHHVFQYIKEGDKEFADRVKRAYRFNHTKEIVNLVTKYLFRGKVIRNEDEAPQCIKDFWKRSTRNGRSISSFMRQLSIQSSIAGRVWVVVDNNVAGDFISEADRRESSSQTFAYYVRPQDVLDMSYDDKGDLNWIMIRETFRDDSNPLDSNRQMRNRYRIWTRNEWRLFTEDEIDSGSGQPKSFIDSGWVSHNLGVVPVVSVDDTEATAEKLYSAPGLVSDVAYLDRAVANYLSNLDAIIQDQTFSQLTMPAQNVLPGEDGYQKILDMGTKRVFLYDGSAGGKPEFISPDVKQAELVVTIIKQTINEIYHSVGVAGERTKQDNSMGIDNSSGVAKAFDFERVNALLVSKADSLLSAEKRILDLVCRWNIGSDAPANENLVVYPESFDIRGLADEFEIASSLILIEAPEALRREQMRSVAKKVLPHAAKNVRDEIDREIDEWEVVPEIAPPMTQPQQPSTGQETDQENQDNQERG